MSNRKDIDTTLRQQSFMSDNNGSDTVYQYASAMSCVENCLVVVSDLKHNSSRIFHGKFSVRLGLDSYTLENSIWEKEILNMMSDSEREEKYLSEFRFFNFLKKIPNCMKQDYYLLSHLKFNIPEYGSIDIMHRLYYWYEAGSEVVRFGICVYSPLHYQLPSRCMAVNSINGEIHDLSSSTTDNNFLSKREKQILSMIETGMTSQDIANQLCISKHTVSRHRQEILANLQVRNSAEAIRRAKLLNIL